MSENRIPLSEPCLEGREWEYVKACLDDRWVSSAGPSVKKFESRIKEYIGARHAVSTVNGTAALHVALMVTGVGPGDEVLVPTLTFIAPANAVRYCGAYPVFMDCSPIGLGLDVSKVVRFLHEECEERAEGTYNKKTGLRVKAVIPVHIFGHPVDMDPLLQICEQFKLAVIEDATESLGSLYKGRQTGSLGHLGCLSFNGNKIITTGGGGMLTTNSDEWAARARHLTTQARCDELEYQHDEIGYNYRLTNLQAALGLAQLERLADFVCIKRCHAERYRTLLGESQDIGFLWEPPWAVSNFWFYTAFVSPTLRKTVIKNLNSCGIEVRPIWQLIHTQPMYRSCQAYRVDVAPGIYESGINLPCSVGLSDSDIAFVVDALLEFTTHPHRQVVSKRVVVD